MARARTARRPGGPSRRPAPGSAGRLGLRLGIVLVVLAGACASDDDAPAAPAAPPASPDREATSAGTTAAPATLDPTRPLPPAPSLPEPGPARPAPAALTVERLGVDAAAIRAVGVEPDGDMEIPAATEVGWYRFGPRPGDDGSAVLAAHIAYDGVDGVFRHLDDLEAGDTVDVAFADGQAQRFRVTEVAQYPKSALPAEVFARSGPSQLVLITCGGVFDRSVGHYEDNVVAYAIPD